MCFEVNSWERLVDFPHPSRPGPEAHPTSWTMGTRSLPEVKQPGSVVNLPFRAFTACSRVNVFSFLFVVAGLPLHQPSNSTADAVQRHAGRHNSHLYLWQVILVALLSSKTQPQQPPRNKRTENPTVTALLARYTDTQLHQVTSHLTQQCCCIYVHLLFVDIFCSKRLLEQDAETSTHRGTHCMYTGRCVRSHEGPEEEYR